MHNKAILLILILPLFSYSQEFRTIPQNAFTRGEELEYNVYWDAWLLPKMIAGTAILRITNENRPFRSRDTYHVVATGYSKGMLNLFYKVEDRYETYIDKEALIPWYFIRRTKEGSYVRNDDVEFDPVNNMAKGRYITRKVPANVQDIISALYYARTLDFVNASPGDVFPVDFFLDDSVYISQVVFEGRETVKTHLGTFNALVFKPMVLVGPVFSEPYPMKMWVTDDPNHVPLLVESKVAVGKVRIELMRYAGMANPVTAKLE
jgi:hypothetical protein